MPTWATAASTSPIDECRACGHAGVIDGSCPFLRLRRHLPNKKDHGIPCSLGQVSMTRKEASLDGEGFPWELSMTDGPVACTPCKTCLWTSTFRLCWHRGRKRGGRARSEARWFLRKDARNHCPGCHNPHTWNMDGGALVCGRGDSGEVEG